MTHDRSIRDRSAGGVAEAIAPDKPVDMLQQATVQRRVAERRRARAEAADGETAQASFAQATEGGAAEVPFRSEMERSFGHDFSQVRAHIGAGEAMGAMGARAAAQGDTVAFASATPDRALVAHELTHVVQTRQAGGGGSVAASSVVSRPGDAAEREADNLSARVVAGEAVVVRAAPSAGLHRDIEERDLRLPPLADEKVVAELLMLLNEREEAPVRRELDALLPQLHWNAGNAVVGQARALVADLPRRPPMPSSEIAKDLASTSSPKDVASTSSPKDVASTSSPTESQASGDANRSHPPDPRRDPRATFLWFRGRGEGWVQIKQAFIRDGVAKEVMEAQMGALKAFRKQTVDALVHEICEEQQYELGFTAMGSDDPGSDYDVQLFDTGKMLGDPVIGVKLFNERFRRDWNTEAGTAFDTNVYDPSFRLPRPGVEENPALNASEARVAGDNDPAQDVGALAKIRRYMKDDDEHGTSAQWDAYKAAVLQGISPDPLSAPRRAQAGIFLEVEDLYDFYREDLQNEIERLDKDDDDEGEVRLEASNNVYATTLEKVREARLEQRRILIEMTKVGADRAGLEKQLDAATLHRKNAMVYATMFASEAYHSEGPMIDVVGNQQKGFAKAGQAPRPLSDQEAVSSFNEQFGDALKDFAHYRHDGFVTSAVQCSKYVYRMVEVAQKLDKTFAVGFPPLAKLGAANTRAYAARKDASIDREAAAGDLSEVGVRSVDDYVALLTEFSVALNVAVRSGRRRNDA